MIISEDDFALLRPLSRQAYFAGAALLSAAYVLALLGVDFVGGSGPYWLFPKGIVGGGANDAEADPQTLYVVNREAAPGVWEWFRHNPLLDCRAYQAFEFCVVPRALGETGSGS